MNGPELQGCRILVVEDEAMVAMALEALLEAAGCVVIGPFPRLRPALVAAAKEPLDIALLDVDINGDHSFPVADALRARHVPIVFLTGYGAECLPKLYESCPFLTKPYSPASLMAHIADMRRGSELN